MRITLTLALVLASLGTSAQSRSSLAVLQQLAEIAGAQAGTNFGWAVAVSGNAMVVGAPLASSGCQSCGAAYVFSSIDGDWNDVTLVATFTESNGEAGGGFGTFVSMSGDTIVVSGTDANTSEGAAYVFVEPSGGWQDMTETAELTVSGLEPFDNLFSVATSGDAVAVGVPEAASNKAYIYVKPSGGWTSMTQTAELVSSESPSNNDSLGLSIAISGDNVVVGAPGAKVNGAAAEGLAYLFVQPTGGWSGSVKQKTELTASDGAKRLGFGDCVSASGETIAVGAPGALVGSNANQGAVYVFTKPSGGWPPTLTETIKLTAKRGKAGAELGDPVVLSGNIVVAGTPSVHALEGSVAVFSSPSSGWQNASEVAEVSASDGAPNDLFGHAVALSDGGLVVGSYGWPNGNNEGAAYVFGMSR
jgi:hypothetical protein